MSEKDNTEILELPETTMGWVNKLRKTKIGQKIEKEVIRMGFEKAKEKIGIKTAQDKVDELLKKYELKLKEECTYLTTLALQSEGGKRLEELYEPLTLCTADDEVQIKINNFKNEIFGERNRVLIEDDAGMGKSTLVRFLILKYLQNKREDDHALVFIELRKIRENHTIKDFIKDAILDENSVEGGIDLILEKKLIIFFDGFDEVEERRKSLIANEINKMTLSSPGNKYIITSRSEKITSAFTTYLKYKIEQLTLDESKNLLKRYMQDEEEMYEELVKEIDRNQGVLDDFLKTPLLASLLYKVYSFKRSIPKTKLDYYDQVFEALYQDHDSVTKPGYLREIELGKLDFRNVLEEFSALDLKSGKLEFSYSEVAERLERIKKLTEKNFSTEIFIENLEVQVPVFKRVGNNYTWAHKSMQEFFFANKINKMGQDKERIIRKFLDHDDAYKYMNLLEFLYDLEPDTFKKIVFGGILDEWKEVQERHTNLTVEEQEIMFKYPKALLLKEDPSKKIRTSKKIDDAWDKFHKLYEEIGTREMLIMNDQYTFAFKGHKYFPILGILEERKVDVFLSDKKSKISSKEIENAFEMNRFYYYSEKNNEEFFLISQFISNEELLSNEIDLEKIKLEYKLLEEKEEERNKLFEGF